MKQRAGRRILIYCAAVVTVAAVALGGGFVVDAATTASYVLIGTPAALQIPSNNPFTVEGWVYHRVLAGGTSGRNILYSKNSGRAAPYTYMFGFIEGGKLAAYNGSAWIKPVDAIVAVTGRWYHVAFSFDGTSLSFYLDGELVGTPQPFTFTNNAAHTVKIGGYASATDINGQISDVRVWNHARTQSQIRMLKGQRLLGTEAGLLAYWPLNEGSGTITYDRTTNGCNGTLQACTWAESSLDLGDPFRVCHPVTKSTEFTNTNVVEVLSFGVPLGCTHYAITFEEIPPDGGWISVSPAPATVEFPRPESDQVIRFYCWFTNLTEEVPLAVMSNRIVYTTAAPEPVVTSTLKRLIVPGHPVTIKIADVDAGSTTGDFEGTPIGLYSWRILCEDPLEADAAPALPEAVFTNAVGWYRVRLEMMNWAGTTATSATACVVRVLPIVAAYDSMAGYENTRMDWPEQWVSRWSEPWDVDWVGGANPPAPLITSGYSRHSQHNILYYSIREVQEKNLRVKVDLNFNTDSGTVGNYAGLVARFLPNDPATPANERKGYRFIVYNANQSAFLQRVVGGTVTTLASSTSNVYQRTTWTTLMLEIDQTTPTATTLRAKIWPRSAPEPTNWLFQVTDSNTNLQNVTGRAGLYGETTGNRYYYFQNFWATRLPFQVANPETGSEEYVSGNSLRVLAFDPPEGYDAWQITETDSQPGDDGWQSITSPPRTVIFTPGSSGSEATLYLWFTNWVEDVPVVRMFDTIRYTTEAPTALVHSALSHEIVPGASIRITAADVDGGSVGGWYGTEAIPIATGAVACVWPEGGDATPDAPYVTLTNAGVYILSLSVTNAAGIGATSAQSCTVTVTRAETETADRYVIVGNPLAAAPYGSWETAAPDIQSAVDAASGGETILVWKGVYDQGGRTNAAGAIPNRLIVDKAVTVRAASSRPEDTIIRGRWHTVETYNVPRPVETYLGTNATRGVLLYPGARLEGFTIEGGATRAVTGADGRGGGVWASNATAVISNCVIRGNMANEQGGGVWGGTLIECRLEDNRSFGTGGGAAYAVLRSCGVSNNAAASLGGGVAFCTSYWSVIARNRDRTDGSGGGGGYNSVFYNCWILHNRGGVLGGGLYGGAAYNSVIAGNWTQSGTAYGGGACTALLYNCTVTGNRSATYAGGVHLGTNRNSIVFGNSARVDQGGLVNNYWTNTPSLFLNSCTEPAIPGWDPSNIASDPLFRNAGTAEPMVANVTVWSYTPGDYRLQAGSPGIGRGANETWMFDPQDVRSLDLEGNKRVSGAAVDMGAFERLASGTVIFVR